MMANVNGQVMQMKPVLQAILLADRVYEDKTGKKIIAGTFNRIFLSQTVSRPHPTEMGKQLISGGTDIGSPSIYVSLTDLVADVDITLRLVNVSKNIVMLECPVNIKCPDRLATVEIVLALPPFGKIAMEPGTYTLDLVWRSGVRNKEGVRSQEEELLGSHRLTVENAPNQDPSAEQNPKPEGGV